MSFSKYYVPSIEIKDFNVLIDGKNFFDVLLKNKEETYEKLLKWEKIQITQLVIYWIMDMNILSKYYSLTAIDLSQKIKSENLI